MKKMKYLKGAITSLVLVAAMALPMTAMAAEVPSTPSAAPASVTQAEDNAAITEYVNSLDTLTAAEKQELIDAYIKLAELDTKLEQTAEDSSEFAEIDKQMAALESKVAALEDKAFPVDDDGYIDQASYDEYVNTLDLTDAEKKELVSAFMSMDDTKICVLELKAFANSVTKQAGGESQAYRDAAEQFSKTANEMIDLLSGGASDEQLNSAEMKMISAYDRLVELAPNA